jgi:hypothetical protein
MRYCFTTLAINEPYETITPEFYKELREKTKECEFFITTNNEQLRNQGDRIHTKIVNPPLYDSRGGFNFNLNLKVLSLKHILEHQKETGNSPDYIIFTDGDWRMHDRFDEQKILNMLDHMEQNNVDFLFERPAPIGPHKLNPNESFFRDKLFDYDVFDHNKWDEAHVVNEQFLVFRNNSKFKFFVQRWEQFLWYSIANDIRNYPDGFEIGISALEADMKYQYEGVLNHFIQNCFSFYTKLGDFHVRF